MGRSLRRNRRNPVQALSATSLLPSDVVAKKRRGGVVYRGEERRAEEREGEYARPLAFIGVHLSQGT